LNAVPPALSTLLQGIAAEIRRLRAERGAWRGGFWGAVVASAVLAAKGWVGDAATFIALAAIVLGVLSGALLAAMRRVPPFMAARLADRAYALQDRVATALESSSLPSVPAPAALVQAQVADAVARVEALRAGGGLRRHVLERRLPRDAYWVLLPLLVAGALSLAPPLPVGTIGLQDGPGVKQAEERTSVSFLERLKMFGTDMLRPKAAPEADVARQEPQAPPAAPNDAAEFKDRTLGKQPGDFASFVKKGDDRLKVLDRADRLPDLQSDFASSNVRSMQQKAQELAAAKGTNQMSAAKLNQVLRELERMGRKAGDENMSEEMRQAMQMAEDGNLDEAMQSMQEALGKMQRAEDQQRASKMLKGGPDGKGDRMADSGEAGDLSQNTQSQAGASDGKGSGPQGNPSARLRSTPYDAAIQGQRRGRAQGTETDMMARPGALGAQLQYLGEIGQYRRQMEDAIAREQIPRDYHNQIRDYFKSLQEQ
jgi:hypothetical protein